MNKDYFSNIDDLLSKNEKKMLTKLDKKSNKINKKIHDENDPLNMSIKNLFEKWASVNINIFVDITNFISNLSKYNKYFDDIDETGQWYNGIVKIFKDFSKILIENNRPIYFGITLVLLSFALYLIQITS